MSIPEVLAAKSQDEILRLGRGVTSGQAGPQQSISEQAVSGPETSPSSLPRYRRAAVAPAMLLTPRDRAVLLDVWRFRFLTTSQIELLRLHDPQEENRFVSRLTLTRRLKLLFHHRYLRRIARPLAQGSREPVYVLDTEGARLLSQEQGEVRACPPSRLPRLAALDHLLDIVQMRLSLEVGLNLEVRLNLDAVSQGTMLAATRVGELATLGVEDAEMDGQRVQRNLVAGVEIGIRHTVLFEWLAGERVRFRVPVEEAGRRQQTVTIIPDGAAILRMGGCRHYAFVEMDRGTEPQRVLAAKGRAYRTYWESGGFAHDFSVPRGLGFRVLFVVPTERRAQLILRAIRGLPAPRQLFRVALAQDITPERILQPVWWDGESQERMAPFADVR